MLLQDMKGNSQKKLKKQYTLISFDNNIKKKIV